jgi:hypothetical protein
VLPVLPAAHLHWRNAICCTLCQRARMLTHHALEMLKRRTGVGG